MTKYPTVRKELHNRFATVSYLDQDHLLIGAPDAIHDTPAIYTTFDGRRGEIRGQVRVIEYRARHRFLVKNADPESAEKLAEQAADDIPDAVHNDRHLNDTVDYADTEEADGAWVKIGSVNYRIVDFVSTVIVKKAVTQ